MGGRTPGGIVGQLLEPYVMEKFEGHMQRSLGTVSSVNFLIKSLRRRGDTLFYKTIKIEHFVTYCLKDKALNYYKQWQGVFSLRGVRQRG